METRTEKDRRDSLESESESVAWSEAFPAIDWDAVDAEWAAIEYRALMESVR